jgi:hypothetical protein
MNNHPPSLRELYLDIATVEAIDKLKGQQPDTAFVLLKDELSGLFGSYGAYKTVRRGQRGYFVWLEWSR